MTDALEDRVWAYLDGLMTAAEAADFERDLLEPGVARALAEALMMREMLNELGPDAPPDDVLRATEKAVLAELKREQKQGRRFGRARAALSGLSWAYRGPQLAMTGSVESTREGLSELGNTRYTLGPLGKRGDDVPRKKPRRGLLRRLLLRRRKK